MPVSRKKLVDSKSPEFYTNEFLFLLTSHVMYGLMPIGQVQRRGREEGDYKREYLKKWVMNRNVKVGGPGRF